MSISKVAELASVSHATVSRVINQRAGVAEETVAKVRQAMEEIGYVPPRGANRQGPLAAGRGVRTGQIALLWSSNPANATETVGLAMLEGLSEGASDNGLNLMVGYLREGESLPGMLDTRKIDGLILHGKPLREEQAQALQKFPAVWMLSSGNEAWGDRVQPDHQGAARVVLDAFVARGRKKLACISNSLTAGSTRAYARRAEYFRELAEERGLEVEMLIDRNSTGNALDEKSNALNMVHEVFSAKEHPDALFVANDLYVPVVGELWRLGLEPGRDVLMARCNRGPSLGRNEEEHPLVVDIRPGLIGQLAVQQLMWRIGHPDVSGQVRMQVSPVLVGEE